MIRILRYAQNDGHASLLIQDAWQGKARHELSRTGDTGLHAVQGFSRQGIVCSAIDSQLLIAHNSLKWIGANGKD